MKEILFEEYPRKKTKLKAGDILSYEEALKGICLSRRGRHLYFASEGCKLPPDDKLIIPLRPETDLLNIAKLISALTGLYSEVITLSNNKNSNNKKGFIFGRSIKGEISFNPKE